jgi:hypothetical protein
VAREPLCVTASLASAGRGRIEPRATGLPPGWHMVLSKKNIWNLNFIVSPELAVKQACCADCRLRWFRKITFVTFFKKDT